MIDKINRLSGLYLIVFLYYVIYTTYLFKLKKASEDGIPMAYHIRLAVDNYFQEQVKSINH